MKAKDFDKKFDDNKVDIINDLDLITIKRPNQTQKRIKAKRELSTATSLHLSVKRREK